MQWSGSPSSNGGVGGDDPSPAREASPGQRTNSSGWALVAFAVGYNVTHHNGLLGTFQGPTGTRIADWIDLLTPFAVLLPLAWFLSLHRPKRLWVAAGIGSMLYVEGHGIHLSANSIGNVASLCSATQRTTDVIHLWDEVVGHYIWFLGLAIVLAVAATAVRGRPLDLPDTAMAAGGALTGLTWATNGLEGGTAVFSLVCALGAVAMVDRRRTGLSVALLAGGTVAVAVIAGFGIVHGGFPQPSSL
ncbi:MAG: hypothetical protein ACR2QK_01805 [Acidimicrobiales bacterium]